MNRTIVTLITNITVDIYIQCYGIPLPIFPPPSKLKAITRPDWISTSMDRNVRKINRCHIMESAFLLSQYYAKLQPGVMDATVVSAIH